MTTKRTNRRRYEHKEVAQLAKDSDEALASMPVSKVVGPVQYTEPLYVALASKPAIFHLVRVRQDGAPSAVVAWGAMTWEWDDGRVRVIDIASMSTGATKYHFTFLVME